MAPPHNRHPRAPGRPRWLRPRDAGGPHTPYFLKLSAALDAAGIATPTLVVDRDALAANIEVLQSHIAGRFDFRIVVKSLPSLPLLECVMAATGSRRLMAFHQPFLNRVAGHFPDADLLLGKPLPVASARNFYLRLGHSGFDPRRQLKWLLDTPRRVDQYDALARELDTSMQVCLELDVGLRRGGARTERELVAMLGAVRRSSRLHFCGFVGYEPHVVKLPLGRPAAWRDRAMARYGSFVACAHDVLGPDWPRAPVLNSAGSPTYQLYDTGTFPINELTAGSCLVKPTDFDLPTLADHRPACFIATPVLKRLDTLAYPGLPLGRLQVIWNPNRARTFFTYGGYWKARPESPPGLVYNTLYGRSSNQEMLNGSHHVQLAPDDWVFLRPAQSEVVFLQFGDLAVYGGGKIVDRWPVMGH